MFRSTVRLSFTVLPPSTHIPTHIRMDTARWLSELASRWARHGEVVGETAIGTAAETSTSTTKTISTKTTSTPEIEIKVAANGITILAIAAARRTEIEERPANMAVELVNNLRAEPEIVQAAQRVRAVLAADKELPVEIGPAAEPARELEISAARIDPAEERAVEIWRAIGRLAELEPEMWAVGIEPVAAVPAHRLARRAAAVARTALAIAAFRPVADLARAIARSVAAAEAPRDLPARAAGTAWAVEDLAEVAVAAAVAEVAAVVAEVADANNSCTKKNK